MTTENPLREALTEIAELESLTATPTQFYKHLQRIARRALETTPNPSGHPVAPSVAALQCWLNGGDCIDPHGHCAIARGRSCAKNDTVAAATQPPDPPEIPGHPLQSSSVPAAALGQPFRCVACRRPMPRSVAGAMAAGAVWQTQMTTTTCECGGTTFEGSVS